MQGQRAVHSSLLSLNHDQRFNRNGHLDKGRFRPHRNLIQIPTKCDLAKRKAWVQITWIQPGQSKVIETGQDFP